MGMTEDQNVATSIMRNGKRLTAQPAARDSFPGGIMEI
jgi:hypothetical protein